MKRKALILVMVFAMALGLFSAAAMADETSVSALTRLSEDVHLPLKELTDASSVLSDGIYYMEGSLSFEGAASASPDAAGANGLTVADGATVYIYIPEGMTLTAIGGRGYDAVEGKDGVTNGYTLFAGEDEDFGVTYSFAGGRGNGSVGGAGGAHATGGGAGIYVPSSSKLVVFGGGKLVAVGGDGGDASNGGMGSSETYYYNSISVPAERTGSDDYFVIGEDDGTISVNVAVSQAFLDTKCLVSVGAGGGGAGGAGGGGAGVGTAGTSGSDGTAGASSAARMIVSVIGKNTASASAAASAAGASGTVIIDTDTIDCSGVVGGKGGAAGTAQESVDYPDEINELRYAVAGSDATEYDTLYFTEGQAGGAGGAGGAGAAFGAGGTGGSGGVGGDSGSFSYVNYNNRTFVGANGASGGSGAAEDPTKTSAPDYPYSIVTFEADTSTTSNYYITNKSDITIPDGTVTVDGESKAIQSWTVKTGAATLPSVFGVDDGGSLLAGDDRIYKPGDTVTVNAMAVGNVVMQPDTRTYVTINVTAENVVYDGSVYADYSVISSIPSYDGDFEFTFYAKSKDGVTKLDGAPKDAGAYILRVSVPETDTACSGYAEVEFTIAPKAVDVTWSNTTLTFTGAAQAPTASVVGLVGGDTASVTVDGAQTNAGTYTATAASVDNQNYTLNDDLTTSFTINPKSLADEDVVVTLDPATHAYTGEYITPAIKAVFGTNELSGDGVDYTVSSSTTSIPSAINVGEYDIVLVGNGNYIGSRTISWAITKADMTITATDTEAVYDGNEHSISLVGAPAGATISYSKDGETYQAANPTFTDAGTYTVYYKVVDEIYKNYNPADGTATVTITPKEITISGITAADKEYDGTTDATLAYDTAALAGLVDGDNVTITATGAFGSKEAGENKAVAISDLKLSGDDAANYKLSSTNQQTTATASINPKALTVEITPNGGVYDGTITPATGTIVGALEGEEPELILTYAGTANDGTAYNSTATPTLAGTYTVTASTGDPNYVVTEGSSAYTVERANASLSISAVTGKAYGDSAFKLEVKTDSDATPVFKSSDEAILTVDETGTVTLKAAGTATVTVSYGEGNNYKAVSNDVTIQVQKKGASLTVASLTLEKTYGDEPFDMAVVKDTESKLTYKSSDEKVLKVDDEGKVTIVGVGTATVEMSAPESGNYTAVTGSVTITVVPKAITVTADSLTKTYGEADPELTYTAKGVVEGDELTGITLARVEGEDVGEYIVTAVAAADGNPNYAITVETGKLTVEPRDIADAEVTLGAALIANGEIQTQEVAVVTVKNSVGGDMTVTYTVERNTGMEAGTYTMTINGTGNYTGTATKRFVITPAFGTEMATRPNGDVIVGDGSVGVLVQSGTNAPRAALNTDRAALMEMLVQQGEITADDLSKAADGAAVEVIMTVLDATNLISADSQAKIEAATDGYTIGQYLDISLFKQVIYNDGTTDDIQQIKQTGNNVAITLSIPEALLNKDATKTRTFYIVRNHDGTVEFLTATYADGTITFETNQFSDYAIVYKDTANTGRAPLNTGSGGNASTNTSSSSDSSPKTGDESEGMIYGVLLIVSVLGLAAVIDSKKKRNRAN